MTKMWMTLTVLCAVLAAQAGLSYGASDGGRQTLDSSPAQSVNQVVQWNKNLLVIVRTPGAQPATIHPTRSFALMHAAIYDAVNAIDGTHKPYLVQLTGVSPNASQDAAAAQAAHDVLVGLYPKLQTTLDTLLQESLAQIPDGAEKADGVNIGLTVAEQILSQRSNDGANAQPKWSGPSRASLRPQKRRP
jgi:hypothetical protein